MPFTPAEKAHSLWHPHSSGWVHCSLHWWYHLVMLPTAGSATYAIHIHSSWCKDRSQQFCLNSGSLLLWAKRAKAYVMSSTHTWVKLGLLYFISPQKQQQHTTVWQQCMWCTQVLELITVKLKEVCMKKLWSSVLPTLLPVLIPNYSGWWQHSIRYIIMRLLSPTPWYFSLS